MHHWRSLTIYVHTYVIDSPKTSSTIGQGTSARAKAIANLSADVTMKYIVRSLSESGCYSKIIFMHTNFKCLGYYLRAVVNGTYAVSGTSLL